MGERWTPRMVPREVALCAVCNTLPDTHEPRVWVWYSTRRDRVMCAYCAGSKPKRA